ncbi:centrosomal protein of 44 kDa isoform X4 [Rhea pennata]|uniref:centrosomal protein of 44 kDa isoform X4 n=1 Tax=Rhea pennata TaxID=8795 RepID=UPI002E26DF4A
MTTGDLKGSLRKIEQGLRLLNYPRDVDYTGLIKGDPAAFLPIISYSFTSFSTSIAELLEKCDVELTAKSDLRFIEAIYKLLRDLFQYKPILTKQQFLQFGFAERKMQIVCDIINCVIKKHKELNNLNKAKSQTRRKLGSFKYELWSNCEKAHADPSGNAMNSKQKPQVERHPEIKDSDSLLSPALPAEGDNEEELYLNHDVLEVKCEQSDLPTEFNNVNQECASSRIPVSPDIERKEEMPESLHQSSGYSSLLSTDPSPKAMTINYHDLTDFSKETTRQRMERISKMIEETSELLKTSNSISEKT